MHTNSCYLNGKRCNSITKLEIQSLFSVVQMSKYIMYINIHFIAILLCGNLLGLNFEHCLIFHYSHFIFFFLNNKNRVSFLIYLIIIIIIIICA